MVTASRKSPHAKILKRSAYGPATAAYLQLAYKDYVAARVLILAGLLSQGAGLASTAVEKSLKALCAFRGMECRGHLRKAHINNAINFAPWLVPHLNKDFIELLRRAYRLRYIDDLRGGFNLVIASREFLAELDDTVLHILERCKIRNENGLFKYEYHSDEERQEPHLLEDNHLFSRIKKATFIAAEPQWIYEFRQIAKGGVPLAIRYRTYAGPSDGNFLREGLVPVDASGTRHQVVFKIIPPDSKLLVNESGLVLRPTRLRL